MNRPDNQLIQVLQDEGPLTRLATPPGGNRRQTQFFPEQMSRQAGQKGQQRRILQDPAADLVSSHHIIDPHRLQQPGNAE